MDRNLASRSSTVTGPPSEAVVSSIVELLRREEVVILPTDTIYGLHCDARSEAAVERIFAMKERERGKPLVVLASSIDQAGELGVVLPEAVREFLDATWPAPLTAVIPLRHPIAASAGAHSLALRIPAITWLRDLIAQSIITGKEPSFEGANANLLIDILGTCLSVEDLLKIGQAVDQNG